MWRFADYISDESLLVNKFVAKDASATCAAFVAGVVQGFLDAFSFVCGTLTFNLAACVRQALSHLLWCEQSVHVTPVRYASNPANTATAKTYIRIQSSEDEEQL